MLSYNVMKSLVELFCPHFFYNFCSQQKTLKPRLQSENFKKIFLIAVLAFALIALKQPPQAKAFETVPLGVHILTTDELMEAKRLTEVSPDDQRWTYVVIPFTLADVGQTQQWQEFFNQARKLRVVPILRLATKVENDVWLQPSYKDITSQIDFLAGLKWPTNHKRIIIFNEVNHAKEWGNTIDPEGYAKVLEFASNWAHSENANFEVLPAGFDLDAPTAGDTKEAFEYLNEMYTKNPEIFSYVDAWNSHSYPNPAFASHPSRTGKNSLSGFVNELDFLKQKTGKDYQVYITETGWNANAKLNYLLPQYYTYALEKVWNHPQVVAVSPFVFKGAPGPYAGFSFVDGDDQPTVQYQAFRKAIDKVYSGK